MLLQGRKTARFFSSDVASHVPTRCRNVFTIEDSTAWERDPAHERTGAWSINARKLCSSSRVHIKTKSK
ncbi:hypothetical protein AV530_000096 [Patagioenas fasciata monilis]|uniref:Uncharacterized protein n=1 Tax=Patagioenas fasciata monilis TaxID=372326 RepID=A0A1V4K012_PATFA|nr:hypothetical protein AV530_000096 [Patagioenas fasciata monilis]